MQLEQNAKDVIEFRKKLDAFSTAQDEMIKKQNKFAVDLDKRLGGAMGYLASDEAKKADRPASDIVKRTIQELRNSQVP